MTLNLQAKDSYHVFDSAGMLIVPSDELSWMDSIGRTVLAWIAYGRPQELANSILNCYGGGKLFRHPKYNEQASRDHISYYCIHRKLLGKYIPPFRFQRGMNLWMKSLTGNKLAERLYYLIYIPGALIGNIWLRICRWAGRISEEYSNEAWIKTTLGIPNGYFHQKYERTARQKLWGRIISISIPAYALHNKAWQIYVMPDSKRKERLKSILLRRVGKSNIMLRLLFEPNVIYNAEYLKGSYKLVTQQEVDNYLHLTGYRPGVYLDETCRRTIRELTAQEAEFNTYEKSLIQWLWNNN